MSQNLPLAFLLVCLSSGCQSLVGSQGETPAGSDGSIQLPPGDTATEATSSAHDTAASGTTGDTGCTSADPPDTVRTVRITTEESPSWVAWFEVTVEGQGAGDASPQDLTGRARVSASSAPESAALAVDGNTASSWNAGDFPEQWLQLDFEAPITLEQLTLVVAQSPSGETVHGVQVASDCGGLQPLVRFEGDTFGGQYLTWRKPSDDDLCPALALDLVLKKTSAPCWDCEFWFDPMGVEEQRPRLEVTWTSGGLTETGVFQDGPLGTHGDLTATFVMGADALLGPGSCAFGDTACYDTFLHLVRTQVWEGVNYYNGLIYSDLSAIPCDARIDQARLSLWIHEQRGLANSDDSSTAAFYRGVRDWDYRYVNGVRYNVDSAGNDLLWTTLGGDVGELVRELHAQTDFWDRGFHKASPDAWFDFTDHVAALQIER